MLKYHYWQATRDQKQIVLNDLLVDYRHAKFYRNYALSKNLPIDNQRAR